MRYRPWKQLVSAGGDDESGGRVDEYIENDADTVAGVLRGDVFVSLDELMLARAGRRPGCVPSA